VGVQQLPARTYAAGGSFGDILSGAAVAVVGGYVGGNYLPADFAGQTTGQMVIAGISSKALGGKFIDGVKGAAAGMVIGVGIKWIVDNWPSPADAITVSESDGGRPDNSTYTKEQWELANKNANQARAKIFSDIRNGDLDVGLDEAQVLNGFDDGIKHQVVEALDGASADVTYRPDGSVAGRAMGRVMDVNINIEVGRAQALGGALESFAHEFRHLSPANRAMDGPPLGVSTYYGPQESDARAAGRSVRRAYGH
jgi:hypothetical protein